MSMTSQDKTESQPKMAGKIIIEVIGSEEEDQSNSSQESKKGPELCIRLVTKEKYLGCDNESDEEQSEEEKDRDEETDAENDPAVFYRIQYRNRTRFPSDALHVESKTPAKEAEKTLSRLEKGAQGQTFSRYFQFRHTLKESNYKNSYLLQLDNHKMQFEENHELGPEKTLHLEPANAVFRGRNMATDELRKVLKLDLHVWKSLFESNRAEQMGELDLSECTDSVTAECLTIEMDSCKNVEEIVKVHKVPLDKFTLICREDFEGLVELEQVRTAQCLKLTGESKITDKQLLNIESSHFEIQSQCVSSQGLNVFIKERRIRDLPDQYFAVVQSNYQNWNAVDVLKGLPFTKYKGNKAFEEKNGLTPVHAYDAVYVHMPIENSEDRLVVIIKSNYFECFKEGMRPGYTQHEYFYLD